MLAKSVERVVGFNAAAALTDQASDEQLLLFNPPLKVGFVEVLWKVCHDTRAYVLARAEPGPLTPKPSHRLALRLEPAEVAGATPDMTHVTLEEYRALAADAGAALRMIREVVEQNAPPGSVPPEEYVEPKRHE